MARPQGKSYRRRSAAAGSSQHHGHGGGGGGGHGRWPARLMDGFRKMLVGLFSFPPRPPKVTFSGSGGGGGDSAPKRPSCSSNLQPVNAHYDEAIADCVEFFHRSACRVDVRSRPHF